MILLKENFINYTKGKKKFGSKILFNAHKQRIGPEFDDRKFCLYLEQVFDRYQMKVCRRLFSQVLRVYMSREIRNCSAYV